MIKESKDLISYFVYNNFNNALSNSHYPDGLKHADVMPAFKKCDKSDKISYLYVLAVTLVKYMNELYRTRFVFT